MRGDQVPDTPTVLLIGTLDTKGFEYAYLRDRLQTDGVDVLVVDVGINDPVGISPDITRHEVAASIGANASSLAAASDRGRAVATMTEAAGQFVPELHREGRFDGILSAGGSGGTAIATRAMQALPVGVPKLMLSTMASGDTSSYVGSTDITMMASITDIAGVNSISAQILANAAAAMVGMVKAAPVELEGARPLVAATMFGVTTPAVTAARTDLEERGYEVLVFHCTGTGGRAMENLIEAGFFDGVLDLTTTELCDELVGGVLSAGPDRMGAAARTGVPQVVSLGALDMVNFGAPDTVPAKFAGRIMYEHNPSVTLMRTTPEESAELGRQIAEKLSTATGPTTLFIPLKGVSMIAVEGQPFYDPDADAALFGAIRDHLPDSVDLVEMDCDINDPAFAKAMAETLDSYMSAAR
jgi:uncharacterized protein (UPF0261 family)